MGLFRLDPQLPASMMKTYRIANSRETHFRRGTCQEVDCSNYTNGWKTVIDTTTDLGKKQAYYIEKQSGRGYTKTVQDLGMVEYIFAAGQQCFKEHQVRLENVEDNFFVFDGDHRGASNVRRHANGADWVDDFQNHQDKLQQIIERG